MSKLTENEISRKEIDIKAVILAIKEWLKFLKSKWLVIFSITLAGAGFGVIFSLLSPPEYEAKTTFVLDEGQESNSLIALPGLAALGVGGAEGGMGLFSGDNLIWLYTSNRMISETLLKPRITKAGKEELLIDGFIDVNKKMQRLVSKLKERDPNFKGFSKGLSKDKLSRSQNRIINAAVTEIRKNYFKVEMEDRTEGIIGVVFTSEDELFSLQFVDEIVSQVNRFYINAKTQKTVDRIKILQQKVDEFNADMNRSMYAAAVAQDAVPYPNPNLQSLNVDPQRKVVDVQVNSTIYTTTVQQLEAAKVELAKEAPLIQVVDSPVLPLKRLKLSLLVSTIVGSLLGVIIGILGLSCRRYYTMVMK